MGSRVAVYVIGALVIIAGLFLFLAAVGFPGFVIASGGGGIMALLVIIAGATILGASRGLPHQSRHVVTEGCVPSRTRRVARGGPGGGEREEIIERE